MDEKLVIITAPKIQYYEERNTKNTLTQYTLKHSK